MRSEGVFHPEPGVRLRTAMRRAPGAARSTVVLLHGRGEYVEKYDEVTDELVARGFDVATFDWRGQGRSTRGVADARLGHVLHFEDYLLDLHRFVVDVVTPWQRTPDRLLLAHSMGGHVGLRYLRAHPGGFARAVMVSPLVGIRASLPKPVLRALCAAAEASGRGEARAFGGPRRAEDFPDNPYTHDPARFRRIVAQVQADPALAADGGTYRWLRAALRSCRLLASPGYARRIDVPVLVVAAGRDRKVDVRATRALVAEIPGAQLVELDRARHEVLMESDAHRDAFWRAFDEFVGA